MGGSCQHESVRDLRFGYSIFVRSESSLLGSYGSTALEIQRVINLVANGKLKLLDSITERFPLEEVNQGLDRLRQKIRHSIRIVIEIFQSLPKPTENLIRA